MRISKYLLTAVTIGGWMLLPHSTSASPLATGLFAGQAPTETGLVENVRQYKNKYYGHRRHYRHGNRYAYRHGYRRYHRRRHYDDNNYSYGSYAYSPYYCDDYYGSYCGYPRYRSGYGYGLGVVPFLSFGFGFGGGSGHHYRRHW